MEAHVDHFAASKRKLRFRLSTLLLVLTIAAILAAWFVDHQRLAALVESPSEKMAVVYRLTNASAPLVAKRLRELYSNQHFADDKNNSVLVVANQNASEQIRLLVEHFDRKNTDVAEPKAVTTHSIGQAKPMSR